MKNLYYEEIESKFELDVCIKKISQIENNLEMAYRDENDRLVKKYFSELENLYEKYRNLKKSGMIA